MDSGENEKKWFVYMGDHHEGPFSLNDIQGKLGSGAVTAAHFVWCEGMSDWKVMTEVPAFSSIFSASASVPKASPPEDLTLVSQAQPRVSHDEKESVQIVPEPKKASKKSQVSQPKRGNSHFLRRLLGLILVFLIFVGLGSAVFLGVLDPVLNQPAVRSGVDALQDALRPAVLKFADKAPFLLEIVPPISKLPDVSEKDYRELKDAASATAESALPRAALALSTTDLLTPVFHVAANLPEGASFDILAIGNGETLLGTQEFSASTKAKVFQRMGKSAPLVGPDNKPVPRGEYRVMVFEADDQPQAVKAALSALPTAPGSTNGVPKGKKIVATKSFFLGGPKDASYEERLKAFHKQLIDKAAGELGEIKQFQTQVISQFRAINEQFDKARKIKNIKQAARAYEAGTKEWNKIQKGLSETVEKWSPEQLGKDYYYGKAYLVIRDAVNAVSKAGNTQDSFFVAKSDLKSFEIKLGESRSQVELVLSQLGALLEQIEKLPKTPAGLPTRLETEEQKR